MKRTINTYFFNVIILTIVVFLSVLPIFAQSPPTFLFKFGTFGSGDGQFNFPFGLAVDAADRIIVTENFNNRVQIFDESGNFLSKFGSVGSGNGQFSGPRGIAVNSSSDIIVADPTFHRIQVFDSSGNFLFKFGSRCVLASGIGCVDPDGPGPLEIGDGQFFSGEIVAVNATDNIIVSDRDNSRIQVFDQSGNFLFKFGSRCVLASGIGCVDPDGSGPLQIGDGQFNFARGVAVDESGNIIISDTRNHRIQVFDPSGNFLFKFGTFGSGDGQVRFQIGVTVNNSNQIIVADAGNHRIQVFDSLGNFLYKFGNIGSNDGQFLGPRNVAVDGTGRMIITDPVNHRVQVFGSPVITAKINIKPGSDPNSINPRSKGKIPVAILTTSTADGDPIDFDATTVDPLSVEFGPGGAAEAHGKGHLEDVDGDGDSDLVLHFKTQETGIQCGDTEASFTGETFGGQPITGTDDIQTVGCNGAKAVAEVQGHDGLPEGFNLYQNYPNPFNPETEIRFGIPESNHVVLTIFDILGNEIRTLVDAQYNAGDYSIRWDAKDHNGNPVPSGVYLYQIQVGDFSQVKKMSLMR